MNRKSSELVARPSWTDSWTFATLRSAFLDQFLAKFFTTWLNILNLCNQRHFCRSAEASGGVQRFDLHLINFVLTDTDFRTLELLCVWCVLVCSMSLTHTLPSKSRLKIFDFNVPSARKLLVERPSNDSPSDSASESANDFANDSTKESLPAPSGPVKMISLALQF